MGYVATNVTNKYFSFFFFFFAFLILLQFPLKLPDENVSC